MICCRYSHWPGPLPLNEDLKRIVTFPRESKDLSMNEIPSWLQGLGLLCVMLLAGKSAWPIASRAIEQRRVERNRASIQRTRQLR